MTIEIKDKDREKIFQSFRIVIDIEDSLDAIDMIQTLSYRWRGCNVRFSKIVDQIKKRLIDIGYTEETIKRNIDEQANSFLYGELNEQTRKLGL